MKNILIFIGLFGLLLSNAFAYSFQANVRIYADRTYGEVLVINNLPRPIYCQGRVDGITVNRSVANSFIDGVIASGSTVTLYVYTNNYNPFVRVVPQIICSTL